MSKTSNRKVHRNIYTSLRNIEDYLTAIWQLSKEQIKQNSNNDNIPVHIKNIAEKLQISSSSVSIFVRKLEKIHKIIIIERKGVILTTEGVKDAELIVNKQQLIECFLIEILKLDQESAHLQSHSLEHVMQPATINKLHMLITSIRGQCTLGTCRYKHLCELPRE